MIFCKVVNNLGLEKLKKVDVQKAQSKDTGPCYKAPTTHTEKKEEDANSQLKPKAERFNSLVLVISGTMVYSLAKSLGGAVGLFIDRSAIWLALTASVLYPTEYFQNMKMKRELKIKLEKILESERA
ncbi:hypothetical protein POM88_004184 [Heracleum sosnowskyi]|uniref:Uncharacterized protein n=1 Tax=Heracleum sosnowskyi TaxID=360622 RepID=A0AAD8JJC2_9APIA|nr:hypothetical protein POM88_004184 [Heracleum sosnowskyi]